MSAKRVRRKTPRTPEEEARIKAIREKFQKEKPSLEQLIESGEYEGPIQAGAFWEMRQLMTALKAEREKQQLTIAQLADRTGIDKAAISRLETGKQVNPTVDTIFRLAAGLGIKLRLSVRTEAQGEREQISAVFAKALEGLEDRLKSGLLPAVCSLGGTSTEITAPVLNVVHQTCETLLRFNADCLSWVSGNMSRMYQVAVSSRTDAVIKALRETGFILAEGKLADEWNCPSTMQGGNYILVVGRERKEQQKEGSPPPQPRTKRSGD
jgi:transcriptional regulator with XRE-family HTH domain